MFLSTNSFFEQDERILVKRKRDVGKLLRIKGYNYEQVGIYLKAYDYFTLNPKQFDGATFVKDLEDIPNLDLDAMLHDYHYLVLNVSSNLWQKTTADWIFSKGQEKKGKGIYAPYSRFLGLTLLGIFVLPYSLFKRGRMSAENRETFTQQREILLTRK